MNKLTNLTRRKTNVIIIRKSVIPTDIGIIIKLSLFLLRLKS